MKAIKTGSYKGVTSYRFGKWSVRVTRKTISTRAGCGLRNNTSVVDWFAIDTENPTPEFNRSGYGGIRDAIKILGV